MLFVTRLDSRQKAGMFRVKLLSPLPTAAGPQRPHSLYNSAVQFESHRGSRQLFGPYLCVPNLLCLSNFTRSLWQYRST